MKIGLIYDLKDYYLAKGYSKEDVAEFDSEETISAIENTLLILGYDVERIGNVKALIGRLASGDRWDMVFNIAEGLHGFGREAQVPAILEAYAIPYTFSDPLVLSLALHKGMTKRVLRDLGIPTPDFVIIEELEDIDFIDIPFPLFAKPVSEGTGKGIDASSKIEALFELRLVCERLLSRFQQPVLVESFLPGREFTVGITGTGKNAAALGVMEILFKNDAEGNIYSYANKENYQELVEYKLVDDTAAKMAKETALAAWRGLGCRDAGRIDLRADAAGVPNIMEINPLAGLHPEHSDLPIICKLSGLTYHDLISMIMASAIKRLNL